MSETKYVAAVRIRGPVNTDTPIRDTIKMLNLHRKNYCSVYKSSPSIIGMLKKAKDYITFGEISAELYEKLKKERGEKDPRDSSKLKPFFRLSPPKGGFERKGVKVSFVAGGALGDRKEKMGELIERML